MNIKRDFHNDETYQMKSGSSRSSSTNQLYALSYRVMDLMDNALADLMNDIDATCAMVIDRTGCVMSSSGNFENHDPSNLGATAAAIIAAVNTFASGKQVNEASFRYELETTHEVYFLTVEKRLVLCILHQSNKSDELKEKCKLFVKVITKEIQEDKEKILTGRTELQESVSYIESKLDQLFKDHLT